MQLLDWLVLIGALLAMLLYGLWKGGRSLTQEGYLLAGRSMPWYMVGLSVMATQASAVTFLSGTGQGFTSGLRFVQFYFGLPLAMVVISLTAIPIFHRLRVFTAYEYLETRFDLRTRLFTGALFLISRGLSNGISLYAPALVLSSLLGWDIYLTCVVMGSIVVIYTVTGGAKAVGYTQLLQMGIIWGGMLLAVAVILRELPSGMSFTDALHVAGNMDHLKAIDTRLDLNDRYTLWSGLIGGFFLQLAYFGTDQSQVQRYLTGSSVRDSRLGLLLNGVVKIPFMIIILSVGVMVFVFYQFGNPPIYFNPVARQQVLASAEGGRFAGLERQYETANTDRRAEAVSLADALRKGTPREVKDATFRLKAANETADYIRGEALKVAKRNGAPETDTDYVFLTFVVQKLPRGLIGLIMAVIFAAAMSSTAGALSSLASTTSVDFYHRLLAPVASETQSVRASQIFTLGWGVFSILIALFASHLGSLIEAVNIIGSLFYGPMLGIFVIAFFFKRIGGRATFWAALVVEGLILLGYWRLNIAYLWYNLLGCVAVLLLAMVLEAVWHKEP